jgi:hypothetical protein
LDYHLAATIQFGIPESWSPRQIFLAKNLNFYAARAPAQVSNVQKRTHDQVPEKQNELFMRLSGELSSRVLTIPNMTV